MTCFGFIWFAVRSCRLLQAGDVHGIGAFLAGFDVELNPVAFLNFVDEAGLVNEDFLLIIVGDDEAEAFGVVEEFNGAGEHVRGVMKVDKRAPGPPLDRGPSQAKVK